MWKKKNCPKYGRKWETEGQKPEGENNKIIRWWM